MSSDEAVAALLAASDELLYPSETDAPFTPVVWKTADGPITAEKLLKRARKRAGTPIQEIPLDEFFRDLTAEPDWYGPEEKTAAAGFRNLVAVLKRALKDVKVFKVGKTRVDIYVVGTSDDGNWVGLKTTAVET